MRKRRESSLELSLVTLKRFVGAMQINICVHDIIEELLYSYERYVYVYN